MRERVGAVRGDRRSRDDEAGGGPHGTQQCRNVPYLEAPLEGDVVGYGGAKVGGDQADVMTIGVRAHARGRGIGAAILDALLDWSREAGAREIFLDVRPSNKGAIGLYESRGFVEIGRRPRYFRNPVEEAVEMRAPLV